MLVSALGAALCLVVAAPSSTLRAADDPDSGAELIGHPAPGWAFDHWIRSRPLSLESLRGKVVLMRWWTEGCHYCASTLPASISDSMW